MEYLLRMECLEVLGRERIYFSEKIESSKNAMLEKGNVASLNSVYYVKVT